MVAEEFSLFRMAFLQLGQFLLLVLFGSLLRWWSWWFKIEWWLLGKMASFHTGWGGAEGWQSLRHFLFLAGVGLDALCLGRYLSTVMLLWEFFVYVGFSAVLLGVELCMASYCFLCMRILSRVGDGNSPPYLRVDLNSAFNWWTKFGCVGGG